MNVQEFAALRPGDRVRNPMTSSEGTVTRVAEHGIWLAWLANGTHSEPRYYGVQSTIWFGWDVVPPEPEASV